MISQNNAYYARQSHFDSERMAGSVAHWKNNSSSNASSSNAMSLAEGTSNVKAPSVSFGEILDVVNPLHHLPIVGNVYRSMTGDEISPVAQIIGGTIYGGGVGGAVSIVNAAIQEHSGESDLASAIMSPKSDKKMYQFQDEPRSAGLNRPHKVAEMKDNDIELASAIIPKTKPSYQRVSISPERDELFQQMNIEKREPVTRVSIDVAVAKVKNDWGNLNA